ncbi:DUF4395 domain-containing protein [Kallotenue papyrolyticum]|uniref:DUF4395 domain-containing protein n=1 Tax=Kallotenue papyrolyticum TaxID=1325125 RepID=UPI000478589D|nr:DUF4395 domain-containing protein [Kallotenue papyrolyticum]
MLQPVDRAALKVNQAGIVLVSVVAFVLGDVAGRWLVLVLALILALGTAVPRAALFKQFYAHVLKPLGVVRPALVDDDPRAHLFAQGVGATVLALASLALFAGWSTLGWALVWLVVALAAINLLFNFCAGCFLYYQLARHGLWRSEVRR